MPSDTIMRQLAQFAVTTAWAELPPSIVHETKLVLLDTIGCALFHGALDCFYDILEQHNLKAEEIESVRVFGRVGMDHPLYGNREIKTVSDAQFNPRYIFSVAAHRVRPGVEWMDAATMSNPEILRFMDKVTWEVYRQPTGKVASIPPSRCDVVARGKTYTAEKEYSSGTVGTEAAMTDDELIGKFRHNAARVAYTGENRERSRPFYSLKKSLTFHS